MDALNKGKELAREAGHAAGEIIGEVVGGALDAVRTDSDAATQEAKTEKPPSKAAKPRRRPAAKKDPVEEKVEIFRNNLRQLKPDMPEEELEQAVADYCQGLQG